jgi:hypothetical protein
MIHNNPCSSLCFRLNGPGFSSKIANHPSFGSGASQTGTQCSVRDDKYTGYSTSGAYCEFASDALDKNAHLLVYSGRLGVVIDAAGLAPPATDARNLFTKWGRYTYYTF